ncbi:MULTISPECIES: hypothetical protein [Bradyrhizobium]|uniref:hypothetical protein n=1 Tax=Bradyrhizobium TaxID=374 RepID=UPI000AFF4DD8|nr:MULTISPECIES: hypothetical protein [Bradyrhizobium]
MIGRNLKTRVTKLEDRRKATNRLPYVYHVSEPATADELAAIEAAKSAGHCFMVGPWPCATVEEWIAIYGRPEILQ